MFDSIIIDPDFEVLVDRLLKPNVFKDLAQAAAPYCSQKPMSKPIVEGIPISRVIFSGKTTIVYFVDGLKTTVTCSSHDTYDRQTAIAYALVKYVFGKVGKLGKDGKWNSTEVDGNGLGVKLEKIAASGFDQEAEKAQHAANKAAAKATHEAKQKAEHEAAFRRRAMKRAEELRLEREAQRILDEEDSLKKSKGKTFLNEDMSAKDFFGTSNASAKRPTASNAWQDYVRPNKPFSQFSPTEKREYWRAYNAKRRAKASN